VFVAEEDPMVRDAEHLAFGEPRAQDLRLVVVVLVEQGRTIASVPRKVTATGTAGFNPTAARGPVPRL
jgi:hypothetical protein